ncbi:hypothetical protein Emag_007334 [Eimeria magna]
MARESLEYRLEELQWVDNMSRTVAAAGWVLKGVRQGQSSLTGLADRMRQKQLEGPAVMGDQVECFVGLWMSSVERRRLSCSRAEHLCASSSTGYTRTGQALLGSTVATCAPRHQVATPAAPHEPGAVSRPARPDSPSAPPGTPDVTTLPPPFLA